MSEEKQLEEKPEDKSKEQPEKVEETKPEQKEEATKEEMPKHEEKPKPAPKPVKREYKFNTVSEKKNPLMKRVEYVIQVIHEGQPTPVRADLMKEAAKLLKTSEDGILVEKIFSERSKPESMAKIYVYKDQKDIPKYKLDKLEKRMGKKSGKEEKQTETPDKEPDKENPKAESVAKE